MTDVAATLILSKKGEGENLRDRLKFDHQTERRFHFFLCVGEISKASRVIHSRSIINKHLVMPIIDCSTESTGGLKIKSQIILEKTQSLFRFQI